MEQILNQLLSTTSTIILPHFGAILKIGSGYQFNEFLKYNDGKLIAAVEEQKGVNKDEATEIVSDYIRSIKESLNANKDFEIVGIGTIANKGNKLTIISNTILENSTAAEKQKSVVNSKEAPKTKEITPVLDKKVEKPTETQKKEGEEIIVSAKEELPKAYTSTNLVLDKAIEKILTLKTIQELNAFAKGETREKVLEAINNKKNKILKVTPITPLVKETIETPKVEVEKKKEIPNPTEKVEKEAPKNSTKKVEEKITPVIVSKAETVKKEIKKEENKSPLVNSTKEDKIIKEEKKIEAIPVPLAKEKIPSKKEEENKIEKELMAGAIVIEKEAKKRKRNRIILWLAILLLLIGSSIIGYLKKNEILALISKTEIAENKKSDETDKAKEHLTNEGKNNNAKKEITSTTNEAKEENTKETNETATKNDVLVKEKIKTDIVEEVTPPKQEKIAEPVKKEVEKEVKSTATKGKYNIIGGSFSSEDNANKLVTQLKNDGYNNAKLLGKYGNLYTVSIDNFATRNDAKSTLSDIKEKGYSGWIKKI